MINTLLHSVDEAMFNGMFVTDRLGQTLPGTLEQSFLGLLLALIAAGVVLLLMVRTAAIRHTASAVEAIGRSRLHGKSRVLTELSILHGDNL
jgi:ABC-type antimicrobial peptide transport system permease subunit